MDLLIALKAGSRRLHFPISYPKHPDPPSDPKQQQRLALSGDPDPYFAVNPHLFEDQEIWPAESLRKLCSGLGLAASGSRLQLVDRLQGFDRKPSVGDGEHPLEEEAGGCGESSNLTLRPIPPQNIPQKFKAGLTNAPCGRPTLRKRGSKLILKPRRRELCCNPAERMRMPSPEEQRVSFNGLGQAFHQTAASDGSLKEAHRGKKRQRCEMVASPTDPPRKRIKFSPFNNVQLITPCIPESEGRDQQTLSVGRSG
ncbi:hypothetical protein Emag_007592 [Eimeria magna]